MEKGTQRRSLVLAAAAQDLRYAARILKKDPGFTITAVAVLALAVSALATMFAVLSTVLLRPLPYQSPDQLAVLWSEDPTQGIREGRSALWDVEQWRNNSTSFTDLATFDAVAMLLTGADGVEQIGGASISPALLPLLGVRPVLGRVFSTEEAAHGEGVVLISHAFWRARLAGSRNAIGATLVINGSVRRIVGVLPSGFQIGRIVADVWEPHTTPPGLRGSDTWFVVARLRPAVSFGQAQVEMNEVARRLSSQLPASERNRGIAVVPLSLYMVGPQARSALWMLGGAVLIVFFIAVANVTGLSLARGLSRAREMAVRVSLGASSGRIARQLLTEGVLLAALSGLTGTLLTFAGILLMRAYGPNLHRLNEMGLNPPVLGWILGASLLAGIVVGLTPAAVVLNRYLRPSGEECGRGVSPGTAAGRIRRALVVADFALAVTLLAGAGLLVRSWWNVNGIDPGFRPDRVTVLKFSAPPAFKTTSQLTGFYQRVLDAVQSVPGVESAGLIGDLFIANSRERVVTLEREGTTVSERLRFAAGDEVSPDFFTAIGTPLLRGRFFSIADGPGAPPVAIINDAMARRCWPGSDPTGRKFKVGPPDSRSQWFTVVGVVSDIRRQGPERDPFPQMFVPLAQSAPPRNVDLFLRTSTGSTVVINGLLRAALRSVDRNAPIYELAPLEQQFGSYLAERRFQTSLLTGFSLLALVLSAVGIYGLIRYSITSRTQEIGIRMAVGAQASSIFLMVLADGLKLSLIGWSLGMIGALWLGHAGSSLLFGVAPADPVTLISISLLLIAVSAAACYFPARRAMKIEPVVALRRL